ncbi:MAG TPA: hypothetical protein VGV86_00175 [Acidimicrobiales bacterium]|nr:hypothetical protein [Acidimicrobiales bacterium]
MATALFGALALVLPVSAMATFLGRAERGVELTATGLPPSSAPAVTGDVSGPPTTAANGDAPTATDATTTEEPARPSGGLSPTTTVEVPSRVPSVNGAGPPPAAPATSVLPADDPVVRPPPGSLPGGNASAAGGGAVTGPPPGPPTNDPQMAPCPAADVTVSVTTEKDAYAPGETVRGSSTLANGSTTTCLLPTRAFFRVLDASGKTVGSFAYTLELRMPVKAEPGKTFTSAFVWDQKDCSGSSCLQVPAGTYTAVADWNESGPYSGRGSFRITS